MAQPATRWALITGASSGLGVALATALAARRINLILVARRELPMQQLARQLIQQHGIEVVVEAIDLSQTDSAAALQRRLDERKIQPDILINNAAFGLSSAFIDQDPDRLREMLQLDVMTLTELTQIFGRRMVDRGYGHILLVASMAAYQPTPILAAYGAAKAYVLSLGESLHVELAPKVGVTVLSPGFMDTGFADVSGFRASASVRRTMLSPATVAEIGLEAMFAGKPSVIAGRLNRVMAFATRFLSRHALAEYVFRTSESGR